MLAPRASWPTCLGLLTLALPVAATAAPSIEHRVAVLQGLDKVTAQIELLEVELGETVQFGSLEVRARACFETPPTEPPESAAFLEIDDLGTDDTAESAFVGWMFASTPGVSALEHPVYDIWVVDCREPDVSPAMIIDLEQLEPSPAEN